MPVTGSVIIQLNIIFLNNLHLIFLIPPTNPHPIILPTWQCVVDIGITPHITL
jgi:hypothetical protein